MDPETKSIIAHEWHLAMVLSGVRGGSFTMTNRDCPVIDGERGVFGRTKTPR